jgi:hypothetical protein
MAYGQSKIAYILRFFSFTQKSGPVEHEDVVHFACHYNDVFPLLYYYEV